MSKLELIREMIGYNEWANERIVEAASGVGKRELRRKSELSPLGVTNTLAHMTGTQIFWLGEWRKPGSFSRSWFAGLKGFDGVRDELKKSHRALRRYLSGLSEADLEQEITPPEWWGDTPGVRFPLWHIMMQVVQHSQQHRAEIAQALTALGSSPGDMDYIDYAIGEHKAEWLE